MRGPAPSADGCAGDDGAGVGKVGLRWAHAVKGGKRGVTDLFAIPIGDGGVANKPVFGAEVSAGGLVKTARCALLVLDDLAQRADEVGA